MSENGSDRWLEVDLTWFDPDADVPAQIETLVERVAPLLRVVTGARGIFFNVGSSNYVRRYDAPFTSTTAPVLKNVSSAA